MKKLLLFTAGCCVVASSFAQKTFTHTECGMEFTLAVRSDSTLWTWGFNGNGQLGSSTASATVESSPIQVMPAQKWIYAATGAFHAMGITADSTLWGWGLNSQGNLGIGSLDDASEPVQVNATQHWRYVSAGQAHTMAILNDGTLWATGWNGLGQLGKGDKNNSDVFVQIGTDHWKIVATGGAHTMAIREDGTLWGWGMNISGQLGAKSTGDCLIPKQIGTDNNWAMVSCGYEYTLALKANGTLWVTGFNGNGQLGNSITNQQDTFQQVGTDADWKAIAAGAAHALGIKQNGTLWGWGYNASGQLGIHATGNDVLPTQVGADTDWQYISAADGGLANGSIFGFHSAGLKTNATGVCTAGASYAGQLGDGTTSPGAVGRDEFGCSVGQTLNVAKVANASHTINVYPNPATDVVHIDGLQTQSSYHITNILGRMIQEGNLQSGDNIIAVQSLTPGVYIISITNQESVVSSIRFVKE